MTGSVPMLSAWLAVISALGTGAVAGAWLMAVHQPERTSGTRAAGGRHRAQRRRWSPAGRRSRSAL